jgi:hypothetical protein
MNLNTQEIKRITVKSPSIPLFLRGKTWSPPFAKGRRGGIFKTLKSYEFWNSDFDIRISDFNCTL